MGFKDYQDPELDWFILYHSSNISCRNCTDDRQARRLWLLVTYHSDIIKFLHFTSQMHKCNEQRFRRDNVSITSTLSSPQQRKKRDHTLPVQNESRSTIKYTPRITPRLFPHDNPPSVLSSPLPHPHHKTKVLKSIVSHNP